MLWCHRDRSPGAAIPVVSQTRECCGDTAVVSQTGECWGSHLLLCHREGKAGTSSAVVSVRGELLGCGVTERGMLGLPLLWCHRDEDIGVLWCHRKWRDGATRAQPSVFLTVIHPFPNKYVHTYK